MFIESTKTKQQSPSLSGRAFFLIMQICALSTSFRRKSFDAAQDHELVEWPESRISRVLDPGFRRGDD
jgi:hypothetical protein